jgi:deoxyribonuclease V
VVEILKMYFDIQFVHSFTVAPKEAIEIQQVLRRKVVPKGKIKHLDFVAGVDVAFHNEQATAAVVIVNMPDLHVRESAVAGLPIEFPYIPGLLSFREIPVIFEALQKITIVPDVILCDGQGIAHPRRLGIASHLGAMTGLCTIGVAKSRLTGTHGEEPHIKGEWVPLCDKEETIGAVLCTRDKVKPLYVSVGHRIDIDSAIDVVMRCVTRYRLPQPIRLAHQLAGNAKVIKNGELI